MDGPLLRPSTQQFTAFLRVAQATMLRGGPRCRARAWRQGSGPASQGSTVRTVGGPVSGAVSSVRMALSERIVKRAVLLLSVGLLAIGLTALIKVLSAESAYAAERGGAVFGPVLPPPSPGRAISSPASSSLSEQETTLPTTPAPPPPPAMPLAPQVTATSIHSGTDNTGTPAAAALTPEPNLALPVPVLAPEPVAQPPTRDAFPGGLPGADAGDTSSDAPSGPFPAMTLGRDLLDLIGAASARWTTLVGPLPDATGVATRASMPANAAPMIGAGVAVQRTAALPRPTRVPPSNGPWDESGRSDPVEPIGAGHAPPGREQSPSPSPSPFPANQPLTPLSSSAVQALRLAGGPGLATALLAALLLVLRDPGRRPADSPPALTSAVVVWLLERPG